MENHGTSIIILISSIFGEEELTILVQGIQNRLMPNPPQVLLAHGEAQAAAHIQVLAKVMQFFNQILYL